MDTINIPLPLALTLSALTLLCAFAVIPYLLTCYNTEWMPRWIRPTGETFDEYRLYYPADESRWCLAIALMIISLLYGVASLNPDIRIPQESWMLVYACVPSVYLLHRNLCFHKLNKFTHCIALKHINRINVYRIWKAGLLWLIAVILPVVSLLTFVSSTVLRLCTLVLAAVSVYFQYTEIRTYCKESYDELRTKKEQFDFFSLMPGSYYLLFILVSIVLTQLALWQESIVPLIGWCVGLMVFTAFEYHYRFASCYQTDCNETWGKDKNAPVYFPMEELLILRRRERAALRTKNVPVWVLIVKRANTDISLYDVLLTANIDNKLREIYLREEKLFYIRRFETFAEAAEYKRQFNTIGQIKEKIQELNPEWKELNARSSDYLSTLNATI